MSEDVSLLGLTASRRLALNRDRQGFRARLLM